MYPSPACHAVLPAACRLYHLVARAVALLKIGIGKVPGYGIDTFGYLVDNKVLIVALHEKERLGAFLHG